MPTWPRRRERAELVARRTARRCTDRPGRSRRCRRTLGPAAAAVRDVHRRRLDAVPRRAAAARARAGLVHRPPARTAGVGAAAADREVPADQPEPRQLRDGARHQPVPFPGVELRPAPAGDRPAAEGDQRLPGDGRARRVLPAVEGRHAAAVQPLLAPPGADAPAHLRRRLAADRAVGPDPRPGHRRVVAAPDGTHQTGNTHGEKPGPGVDTYIDLVVSKWARVNR